MGRRSGVWPQFLQPVERFRDDRSGSDGTCTLTGESLKCPPGLVVGQDRRDISVTTAAGPHTALPCKKESRPSEGGPEELTVDQALHTGRQLRRRNVGVNLRRAEAIVPQERRPEQPATAHKRPNDWRMSALKRGESNEGQGLPAHDFRQDRPGN